MSEYFFCSINRTSLGIVTSPSGIQIGDQKFLLMEDQVHTFIEGEIYVVHFAPATHTLLSAGHIGLRDTSTVIDADIAY